VSGYQALNLRSKQVLAGIWIVGCVAAAYAFGWPLFHGESLPAITVGTLVLIGFTTIADLFPVSFEQGYEITVSNVFLIGAIMIYHGQPSTAAAIAIVSTLIWQLVTRRRWYKLLTNVALATTAVVAASAMLDLVGWRDPAHEVVATTSMLAVYFIADTVPMTVLLSSIDGRPFQVAYVSNYAGIVLELVGIELFGLIFYFVWDESPWLSLLLVVPTAILRQAYFQYERLRNDSVRALAAISDVIENRDELTHHHTQSVSAFARRVAERLRLSPDEVWQISVAGQLHDLGKIAVRDAILFKPGKLTENEMAIMRQHCDVGYNVLRHFSNLEPVARLVRAHHERYDGTGYPDGIGGTQLPIGAAIVAVADAFDAMRSDRPYRKAMAMEKALEILKQGLGTQWHPVVGATFIQLMLEDADAQRAATTNAKMPDVAA
jgi:HD-GYP domain-containing protein (c-di-GMP phosphodiesterase class II)